MVIPAQYVAVCLYTDSAFPPLYINSSAVNATLKIAGMNMALSRPTNDPIHTDVKGFVDVSEQATLVLAETSPNHRFVRVSARQFTHTLRQTAMKTVFIGLDTETERQVSWHLLTLASFPPDVRQRVWQQLTLLNSLQLRSTPAVLGLWQVPKRQQMVLITPFVPSHSIDEFLENREDAERRVAAWLEAILQLVETCKAKALSPLHFSLENVRVTASGALVIEDLVHLPDPRDARYLREFLHPSSSCDTAALGHFVLRLREVLPAESPCCDRLTDFAMTCFRHLHEDHVVSMMRKSLNPSPLHVKLHVDWDGTRQTIEFDFNLDADSIDDVSREFLQEFDLCEEHFSVLKSAIAKKVECARVNRARKEKSLMDVDLLTLSPAVKPAERELRSMGEVLISAGGSEKQITLRGGSTAAENTPSPHVTN